MQQGTGAWLRGPVPTGAAYLGDSPTLKADAVRPPEGLGDGGRSTCLAQPLPGSRPARMPSTQPWAPSPRFSVQRAWEYPSPAFISTGCTGPTRQPPPPPTPCLPRSLHQHIGTLGTVLPTRLGQIWTLGSSVVEMATLLASALPASRAKDSSHVLSHRDRQTPG